MDEETNELRNPFPSPPSHYTRYTQHNLKLLGLLKERAISDSEQQTPNQHVVLSDQKDVPEWDLTLLEKPRVDWILDESNAYYDVYGDRWFVKETIPSLAEHGGTQLYPSDPSEDRRPALVSVLKSLLVTYSTLISSLLQPPPITGDTPPEWVRHVEWINVLSQNLMAAANDLRPMQARCNLELMMQRQLELRRQETKDIHAQCDVLEAKLKELRTHPTMNNPEESKISLQVKEESLATQPITADDVLSWAEEIR